MKETFKADISFARRLDKEDVLKRFRKEFFIPVKNRRAVKYFCGHSLGLQPKRTVKYIQAELNHWAKLGVEGHFAGQTPWFNYHRWFAQPLAKLTGAKKNEIVAANTLTVNLHLMLATFYKPTKNRFKILTEDRSFPSDIDALESAVKFHGLNPNKVIVRVKPRKGEYLIRKEDIIDIIKEEGSSLSLVFFSGVNFLTGQKMDIKEIAKHAHQVGAYAGFDLAHAIGNVSLKLNAWKVDFAVWCSYKYLNSGPGAVGGYYVNEKHAANIKLDRLSGWWGREESIRFNTDKKFKPTPTAEGWQLSNAQIFNMIGHRASLEIFEEAGFSNLLQKSKKLTGYLEYLLLLPQKGSSKKYKIQIITPQNLEERGNQLSIKVLKDGDVLFRELSNVGIVADWRAPDIIRLAPVSLYNTFEEVFVVGSFLNKRCEVI